MRKIIILVVLIAKIFFTPTVFAAALSVSEDFDNLFPGYSLYHYESLGDGGASLASFYRVSGSLIAFKHIEFDANGLIAIEIDTLPLPLSEEGIHLFKSHNSIKGANELDTTTLSQNTNWLDLKRLSIAEYVLQMDIQQNVLIVLVEENNGTRRLKLISSPSEGIYQLQAATDLLPADVSLDLFHSSDGEIYFVWSSQRYEAGYAKTINNDWKLSWARFPSENRSFSYSSLFCGVSMYGPWTEGNRERLLVGSLQNFSLAGADLSKLPRTEAELRKNLNRDGWAVINNLSSGKRTHLLANPNAYEESLGELFNGTPLRVITKDGTWTEVAVGVNGLTGWVLTTDLAFGIEMDQVQPAFLEKVYLNKFEKKQPAYLSVKLDFERDLSGYIHIVGIANNNLYILLTSDGHTGYVPSEWMWEGNG